jgi:hypothetical protein
MAGIGSDPNYRAGGGGDSGGNNSNNFPVDINQIADVSSKAFSYFSSTISNLSDQVVKVTLRKSCFFLQLIRFLVQK